MGAKACRSDWSMATLPGVADLKSSTVASGEVFVTTCLCLNHVFAEGLEQDDMR